MCFATLHGGLVLEQASAWLWAEQACALLWTELPWLVAKFRATTIWAALDRNAAHLLLCAAPCCRSFAQVARGRGADPGR